MYLFITYAREDMRGVQVRGLRIAKQFPKKKVLFLNGGNQDWITKAGYRCLKHNFNTFFFPDHIKLPRNIKCIIFCDLPTNRAFQIGLFLYAKEKNIPCVVLENMYRGNQAQETIYHNTAQYADRLILNGLSFMKSGNKKVPVVSPLFDTSLIAGKTKTAVRREVLKKLGVAQNPEKIVFASAYNSAAHAETAKLFWHLQKKNVEALFVVISNIKRIKKRGNWIEIPPVQGDEMMQYMKAADLFISKAGYLQVIEATALGVPMMALGIGGGFRKAWVSKKILDAIIIAPSVTPALAGKIQTLLSSLGAYQKALHKIRALHNGKLNGAELTAALIRKTTFRKKAFPKTLIISLDKERETQEVQKLMRQHPFALPLYLSLPFFTNVFNRKLADYDPTQKHEFLHYNPAFIYSFDYDALHSFMKILPWYTSFLKNIEVFVQQADTCLVVGKETYQYLETILKKYKRKIKIVDKKFPFNVRGK